MQDRTAGTRAERLQIARLCLTDDLDSIALKQLIKARQCQTRTADLGSDDLNLLKALGPYNHLKMKILNQLCKWDLI
jgi:hypothetical protein